MKIKDILGDRMPKKKTTETYYGEKLYFNIQGYNQALEEIGNLDVPAQGVNEELLKEWLKFASDVMPSDAAGTDWLDELRRMTEDALAKANAVKEQSNGND